VKRSARLRLRMACSRTPESFHWPPSSREPRGLFGVGAREAEEGDLTYFGIVVAQKRHGIQAAYVLCEAIERPGLDARQHAA
ncbi:hypothetical protein ACFVZ1_23600, partial [Bacillus subtilis]